MMILLCIFLQMFSHGDEVVDNLMSAGHNDPRYQQPWTWRSADTLNRNISMELNYLKSLHTNTRYAYINKVNCHGGFDTYLVDMSNNHILDLFPSAMGFNGMGCGYGKTRPGVTKLTNVSGTGAHHHSWWGNDAKMYDIQPITGITQCPINNQIVAHSNVNLQGKSCTDRITSHSSGCFTVPPDRLAQMDKYAGNALIYNVPGKCQH